MTLLQRFLTIGGTGAIGLGMGAAVYSAGKAPVGDKTLAFLTAPTNLLLPERPANAVLGKVRFLTQADQRMRGLEMGCRYQDTLSARAIRIRSVEAMSGSLGAARRYLGNEAMLMHR